MTFLLVSQSRYCGENEMHESGASAETVQENMGHNNSYVWLEITK
jgi:hypothetical protein